jgi:hypothetical protein
MKVPEKKSHSPTGGIKNQTTLVMQKIVLFYMMIKALLELGMIVHVVLKRSLFVKVCIIEIL